MSVSDDLEGVEPSPSGLARRRAVRRASTHISTLDEDKPEDLTDSFEAFRDLRCLVQFMDEYVQPFTNHYDRDDCQKVTFRDLWHIFKPGQVLFAPMTNKVEDDGAKMLDGRYSKDANEAGPRKPNDRYQEAWRLVNTSDGRPNLRSKAEGEDDFTGSNDKLNWFWLYCYHVDYTGERFGSVTYHFSIKPFEGERDITTLDIYPLRFANNPENLLDTWRARGEAFREYMTFKHKYYTGTSLVCHPNGTRPQQDEFPKHVETIDSQVVVDFSETLQTNSGWTPSLIGVAMMPTAPRETQENYPTAYWKDLDQRQLDHYGDDHFYLDRRIDIKLMEDYTEHDQLLKDVPDKDLTEKGKLREIDLILLPNRVFAFVLRNRKFGKSPVLQNSIM